jgi:hypothetical protein
MNSIIFKLASPQASSLTLVHFSSLQILVTLMINRYIECGGLSQEELCVSKGKGMHKRMGK